MKTREGGPALVVPESSDVDPALELPEETPALDVPTVDLSGALVPAPPH